jgi:acyl-coenzyme A synthetase/AMP-(fatty) acid ligase
VTSSEFTKALRRDRVVLNTIRHHSRCFLFDRHGSVALPDLGWGSSLGGHLEELRGRSVLVVTQDQLTAALALIELDGIARRLVVCPPGLSPEYLPEIAAGAEINAVVSDRTTEINLPAAGCFVTCTRSLAAVNPDRRESERSEWILLTSGTTGVPKMAVHTLSSLTAAIRIAGEPDGGVVWSTFYDIRRYGGMQIFLRATMGGQSLVLSDAEESTGDFLIRVGSLGVTHVSGTPSHWRRALMSPSAHQIAPRYVRLSGEIVDQGILDSLKACYSNATVVHAFASTEAGVGFDVRDGLAGFPADFVDRSGADVEIRVKDGSLRLRSTGNAAHYLGGSTADFTDAEGFVDTRDMVELRAGRYYFIGRRDGVINVGGLKVHPEEIEAVINRHPRVQMSLVKGRKSPLTGSLVVAEVVVKSDFHTGGGADPATQTLKTEILDACRRSLAPYKVPASIRIVPSLDVTGSGKLARA